MHNNNMYVFYVNIIVCSILYVSYTYIRYANYKTNTIITDIYETTNLITVLYILEIV